MIEYNNQLALIVHQSHIKTLQINLTYQAHYTYSFCKPLPVTCTVSIVELKHHHQFVFLTSERTRPQQMRAKWLTQGHIDDRQVARRKWSTFTLVFPHSITQTLTSRLHVCFSITISASFKPRSYPSFLTHHIPLRWYTHLTLLVPKMEFANLNALYDCCVALEYSVNGILKGSVQMWSTMLLKTTDERGMQWSWISTTVESGYWKTSERCWEEVCLTMLGLLEFWYSLNVSEDF